MRPRTCRPFLSAHMRWPGTRRGVHVLLEPDVLLHREALSTSSSGPASVPGTGKSGRLFLSSHKKIDLRSAKQPGWVYLVSPLKCSVRFAASAAHRCFSWQQGSCRDFLHIKREKESCIIRCLHTFKKKKPPSSSVPFIAGATLGLWKQGKPAHFSGIILRIFQYLPTFLLEHLSKF